MPIKPTRVEISFIPGCLKRLLNFGREHNIKPDNRTLIPSQTCRAIINFALDIRADAEVEEYLKTHGGTLHDLILRALKRYISK